MRIVCISDTHTFGKRITVPDGDVLIHAGDHTFRGTKEETKAAVRWLSSLPHQYKILIAGNHDFYFDDHSPSHYRSWGIYKPYSKKEMIERHGPGLIYLENSETIIGGLKFYGSPNQPWYGDWAFNFAQGERGRHQAQNTWARIPDDTQVLITHGPPQGILDWTYEDDDRVGCPFLRQRVEQLKELRLHVFGHLHESYGREDYESADGRRLTFVNASINTREYEPTNAPIVVEL